MTRVCSRNLTRLRAGGADDNAFPAMGLQGRLRRLRWVTLNEHRRVIFRERRGATPTGMELRHIAMAEFAVLLYGPDPHRELASRFVVDKTDLAGYYDFSLNWAPSNVQSDTANQQASIYTAIQEQLGLKLQPGKGTVSFLVLKPLPNPESPPACPQYSPAPPPHTAPPVDKSHVPAPESAPRESPPYPYPAQAPPPASE